MAKHVFGSTATGLDNVAHKHHALAVQRRMLTLDDLFHVLQPMDGGGGGGAGGGAVYPPSVWQRSVYAMRVRPRAHATLRSAVGHGVSRLTEHYKRLHHQARAASTPGFPVAAAMSGVSTPTPLASSVAASRPPKQP